MTKKKTKLFTFPNNNPEYSYAFIIIKTPGPGCSKLTMLLVNETLKFQMLISQTCQNFLLKKCEKLFQCISFSHFFNKNIPVYLVMKL